MSATSESLKSWRRLGIAQCARCREPYTFEGDMEFGEYCRACLDYIFEQAALAPPAEMLQ